MTENWANFIVKDVREGGLEIEYDGYLKNTHPTQTLYVKISIDTNSTENRFEVVEIPPLIEKMVMSHSCGPTLENEFGFEVVEVYTEMPS